MCSLSSLLFPRMFFHFMATENEKYGMAEWLHSKSYWKTFKSSRCHECCQLYMEYLRCNKSMLIFKIHFHKDINVTNCVGIANMPMCIENVCTTQIIVNKCINLIYAFFGAKRAIWHSH